MSSPGPDAPRAEVELRLPADGAYVSVVRTTTAGLAARLEFTIDDIEDLRIAVGEACALVLPEAEEGSTLVAQFQLRPGRLTVQVAAPAPGVTEPDYDSFAWQVLDTLASTASAEIANGTYTVTLTMEAETTGASL